MTALTQDRPRVWAYVLLWLVLPPLALGYQIAAEETALALRSTPFGAVWFAKAATLTSVRWLLLFEIASFAAWMIVLDAMKLAQAFPASALSFVFVLGVSWTLYHERMQPLELVGAALILAGIWLIGRGEA